MKKSQIVIAFAISFLAAFLFTSCKKKTTEDIETSPERFQTPPIQFTDARGKSISLKHSAIKIVSLLPSITEYIYELDKGHLLIGRSDWCRYPEAALKVEVVGGLDKAVDERLIALKPMWCL